MPYSYNAKDFDPPAPVILIQIAASSRKTPVEEREMLLDSGADMTCVPKNTISSLGVNHFGSIDTEDFDGDMTTLRTCFVNVEYAGHDFGIIEVIELNSDVGLIGRDLLNQHLTTLDGPRLEWEKR